MRPPLHNRFVTAALRSPGHGLLSRRLVLLGYEGRRSGRRFEIPVGYTETADGLEVLVGHPERKRWWRNFAEPRPVELLLRGRRREGVARVERRDGTTRVRIALD